MAAVGDDCYFFCTSTCAKGAACPFRHVESAKTNKIVCQHWQTTGCFRPMCKFRHSDFHIQVNYSEIPCYWESQPVGCSKPNCTYKHNKPRPDPTKTATSQVKAASPEQKDVGDKSNEDRDTFDKFVMPTVKPVIIDPESEASNSSPVKKPPPTEEEPEKKEETAKESSTLDNKANGKGVEKKAVKTIGKKKKAGVLTQKNGKSGAIKKVVKKVKKNADGSPATKVPIKKKALNMKNKTTEESVTPPKKKVQNRLGTKPAADIPSQKKKVEESASSSSDSDDSIENVKVLSMEEIFRQKALESMMKKRAAEGKPMLPEYISSQGKSDSPPRSKPADVGNRLKKPVDDRLKKPVNDRLKKPIAVDDRLKKPVTVNDRLKKPVTVNDRLKKPVTVNDRLKKPVTVNDRLKKPIAVNDGLEKPTNVNRRLKKPATDTSRIKKSIVNNRIKKQLGIKKRVAIPLPPQESEEEEEDESETAEEDEEEGESRMLDDEDDEESASSESESSSSESSESEDDEVRRVVINIDAEKAAREKAKASLVRKRHFDTGLGSAMLKKRKVIREEKTASLSLSRNVSSAAHQRLSVKDRLGKRASTAVASSVTRRDVTNVSSASSEEEEMEDGREEGSNDERFSGVDIRSLEDIRQEKLNRLGNSPVKSRHSLSKLSDVEDEQDGKGGRKILLSDDAVTPKKSRKRPWSSVGLLKKTAVSQEAAVEEDQRTVSATSPVESEPVVISHSDEPESPFESLRRRALLKKTQQIEEIAPSEAQEKESEEPDDTEEGAGGKRKKHKHKHKHKKHKKSKSERQIYVPPAKKSVITEVLEQVKKVASLSALQDDIPEYKDQGVMEPINNSASIAQAPRAKPRAAAMWSAGLSTSSKGLGARPHLRMISDTRDKDEVSAPFQKAPISSRISTSSLSSTIVKGARDGIGMGGGNSTPVPVVKTFSQIMAEKRQKRLQQDQESAGGSDSNVGSPSKMTTSPSRLPSRMEEPKPKAPITPIRFDIDFESKAAQPSRAKSTTASILNRGGLPKSAPTASLFSSTKASIVTSHKSPINKDGSNAKTSSTFGSSITSSSSSSSPTVPLSDIRPTYKTARAKKMFNKKMPNATISPEASPLSDSTVARVSLPSSSLQSSANNHYHQHRNDSQPREVNKPSPSMSSGDVAAIPLKTSVSIGGKNQRRASNSSESLPNPSAPVEDEFAFFDGGDDIEDISDIIGKDVEPIDDLLQDIDDLLA